MENQILKILRILTGLILLLFGFSGIFFGILSIIDPVGTKMSDDADPFGIPPTFDESLTFTVIFILIFMLGTLLVSGLKPLVKLFGKEKSLK